MADKKDKPPIVLDPKTEAVLKRKDYVVMEELSSGSYGVVYKAQKRSDKIYAAVKVMDMTKMPPAFRDKFLPRELKMLTIIKHPYVLEVFDIIKANKKYFIFMEYAPNGDLSKACSTGVPAVANTKKWVQQSAMALAYMHDEVNICHRDIKLENILLNPVFDAKVSDFGFARIVVTPIATTVCGTTVYYSPELISAKYDPKKADVWALGCVLFALCSCKLPFVEWPHKTLGNGKVIPSTLDTWAAFTRSQTERSYRTREGYNKIPADLRDLIDKMMEPDPAKRLTAAQVADHKALSK